MHTPSHRVVGLVCALLAAAALGFALASEQWWGLVPCALCLVERWPLRIVIVLGLLAVIVPPGMGRFVLMLIVLTLLADAAVAAVHVGVEFHWWPSPLPECAAPKFSGGSIAQRLASMPMRPAKPCDSPTYLIPYVPVSMAAMNLGFSLVFAGGVAASIGRPQRRRRRR